eukprot:CAMPEP_0118945316 /NCGR_PEP_ID=MMETSP1169-20130426/42018_1 /TAXON_ID=36882 /ORGANISM="Pyramimonas obovata, Strain CCMP722" /LENGTH=343 /DNA_ID=CAMNT_0006890999 /DNA_START=240 /DNA_END=1268 /DNA_ORIENTATION=+
MTALSLSSTWTILFYVWALIIAGPAQICGRQCLLAECKCEGFLRTDPTDLCGCGCEQVQDPAAITDTYNHRVCTEFNGKESCCASGSIENKIEEYAAALAGGEGVVCTAVWERLFCGLYCDPDLARLEYIRVVPNGAQAPYPGSRSCDGRDTVTPNVVYPFSPVVTGLGICYEDCDDVDEYCYMDAGYAEKKLLAMEIFPLPVVDLTGQTLDTAPFCHIQQCPTGLGGVELEPVLALVGERDCARQCSGSLEPMETTSALALSSLCGADCTRLLNACPLTKAGINEAVHRLFGVTTATEMCIEFDSNACADLCGLEYHATGTAIAHMGLFCGGACEAAGGTCA